MLVVITKGKFTFNLPLISQPISFIVLSLRRIDSICLFIVLIPLSLPDTGWLMKDTIRIL